MHHYHESMHIQYGSDFYSITFNLIIGNTLLYMKSIELNDNSTYTGCEFMFLACIHWGGVFVQFSQVAYSNGILSNLRPLFGNIQFILHLLQLDIEGMQIVGTDSLLLQC